MNLGRLFGILSDRKGYHFNMTVKDDALPGFVVDESSIGRDHGIGMVVRQRWDARVPVLVFPMEEYSHCPPSHRRRTFVRINWFISFRFHSKTAFLRLLDDVVHRSPIKGESDVGIRQKERQFRKPGTKMSIKCRGDKQLLTTGAR